MSDVFKDTGSYQLSRLLNPDQRYIPASLGIWFAQGKELVYSQREWNKRSKQQKPRNELTNREWIAEPQLEVEEEEDEDEFPCKESIKTMRKRNP